MFVRVLVAVYFAFFLFTPLWLFSAEGVAGDSLRIVEVSPLSSGKIRVLFSDAIETESVRVSVSDQDTKENVRVDTYKAVDDMTHAVDVLMKDELKTKTAYVLTVNTAISHNNHTIRAGVDAIRDFITPASFLDTETPQPESETAALNIPPVDRANEWSEGLIPDIDFQSPGSSPWFQDEASSIASGSSDLATSQPEELPATGASSIFIALALAAVILIITGSLRRRV